MARGTGALELLLGMADGGWRGSIGHNAAGLLQRLTHLLHLGREDVAHQVGQGGRQDPRLGSVDELLQDFVHLSRGLEALRGS